MKYGRHSKPSVKGDLAAQRGEALGKAPFKKSSGPPASPFKAAKLKVPGGGK